MGLFDRFKKEQKPDYSNPFTKDFTTPPLEDAVKRNLDGKEAESAGDVDKAIELYEQNVAERFGGSHPYNRLAVIYRKRKDIDNEIRVLETAVDVFTELSKSPRSDVQPKLDKFKEQLEKAKAKKE